MVEKKKKNEIQRFELIFDDLTGVSTYQIEKKYLKKFILFIFEVLKITFLFLTHLKDTKNEHLFKIVVCLRIAINRCTFHDYLLIYFTLDYCVYFIKSILLVKNL